MSWNPKNLLRDYQAGLGFKPNDLLRPRDGAAPYTFGVIDNTVVVLEQSLLAPHQYKVLGERQSPQTPSDRFVRFEINGHDWQKVGRV